MIELPEALNISRQITKTIAGKSIVRVTAAQTPHKLAWYYGDLSKYSELLDGHTVEKANAYGGLVEIKAGKTNILFGEGICIRFHETGEPRPSKHQFLVEFEDRSALSAVVQMYSGVGAFSDGDLDDRYYLIAKEKPSPFSTKFDDDYFHSIISAPEVQKLSLKALLATEQRIPELGNGVLQDILFNSGMHPKKKVNTLNEKDVGTLFEKVKSTLTDMAERGGRDTESDLFGCSGGYQTILSKRTINKPCPICGTSIKKEAYLGGTIYSCKKCQRI
ncbi:MAG: endonuclease VIII [Euryarchaeota archaeon]|nr:endonuclease VIII [Euryarchaeota archaeon]